MNRAARAAVLCLVVSTGGACASARVRLLLPPEHCFDGLPVQLLIDARCPPDGICGYSCMPDRWQLRAPEP